MYICFKYRQRNKKSKVYVSSTLECEESISDLENRAQLTITKKPYAENLFEDLKDTVAKEIASEKPKPKVFEKPRRVKVLYKYAVHPMSYQETFDLYADMKLKSQYHQISK